MNLHKLFIKYLLVTAKKINFTLNYNKKNSYYNINNYYEVDKYFVSTIFN